MRYFTAKTKYILACITMSPVKADGSRDIIEIEEIAKSDSMGVLYYLSHNLYKDKDNRHTARANDTLILYNVITVAEAKNWKSQAVNK